MRISYWKDYELIDASSFERLERFGNIILVRPDPQVIWKTARKNPLWKEAHAYYHRSNTGGGYWEIKKDIPESFKIKYNDIILNLKTMGFKHTGVFPEQATNWEYIIRKIKMSNRKISVLNLFAYTGGATLAAASAGANVCHVDASKGMVQWAKENACLSNMKEKPIRFIVDDCIKFVKREIRRGNKYDAIIMDPPSYGRGPNKEIWKIEEKLFFLLKDCATLFSDNPLFLILNSYTTGLSPVLMEYVLNTTIKNRFGGSVFSEEIGLPVKESEFVLPCGSTAIWEK